jgi:tetratricopeptide (TPR) repeat protein
MQESRTGPNRITIALVAVSVATLAAGALVLRTLHGRVLSGLVRTHILHGDELANSGELQKAVVQYRAALQLERDDPEAARSLALTLLRLGRLNESESYLRDLLRRDPTDGVLNRGLARIHATRGRDVDARAAYQRAIYGHWPGDPVRERSDTRFELVEYLVRSGAPDEVVAELLRLRTELPAGRIAEARRTADLLSDHGVPHLALEMLTAAAQASPRDVDLLTHLADLQIDAGRTVDARQTLQRAVAVEGRPGLRTRLALVNRVLLLDPTLPRLGIVARTRRARLLLNAVLARTEACRGQSAELTALRREAVKVGRPGNDAARAERELVLASQIWRAAPACHGQDTESRAIGEVLAHLEDAGAPI